MAEDLERIRVEIEEILSSAEGGSEDALRVIAVLEGRGVDRATVSFAISHYVAHGVLILDGRHRLSRTNLAGVSQ